MSDAEDGEVLEELGHVLEAFSSGLAGRQLGVLFQLIQQFLAA